MDCVICFETFNCCSSENGNDGDGVQCPSGHFVCTPDFQRVRQQDICIFERDTKVLFSCSRSQYMYETVLCQVFKLRRNKGRISCPVPECSDCIHSLLAFDRLAERERLRYLSILNQENSDESSNVQRVKGIYCIYCMYVLCCVVCMFYMCYMYCIVLYVCMYVCMYDLK